MLFLVIEYRASWHQTAAVLVYVCKYPSGTKSSSFQSPRSTCLPAYTSLESGESETQDPVPDVENEKLQCVREGPSDSNTEKQAGESGENAVTLDRRNSSDF